MRIASILVLLTALISCDQSEPATDGQGSKTVFHNGVIYAVDEQQTVSEAMVIDADRIVFTGSSTEALATAGESAVRVDLNGKFVMPGLVDAHAHPVRGALKDLYHCNFAYGAKPLEIQQAIDKCVSDQPASAWIIGGQWDSGFFENHDIVSPRMFLDAVSGDKAVYLADDSLHNAWVNTRALELAGFDASTLDPANGTILREADGHPNGILLETAAKLMGEVRPEYSANQAETAVRSFKTTAAAFGLTGVKDASSIEFETAAWHAVDQAEGLTLHVATSLRTIDGQRREPLDYAELEARRDRYKSTNVDTRFVKLFLDGVPTPARTAAMLAPYLPDDLHLDDFDGGPLLIQPDTLARDVTELDRRGFTVKMHAAGDRSVRHALDAIEAARGANGPSGLRHEIAHAGYISEADMPRFATLNAVADMSPILWFPSPIMDAIYQAVGKPRGEHYYPVRDLIDLNTGLLAGSDWPAVAVDANPWVGIESLITRRDPLGKTPGQLWPEQAITLAEALRIYTLDGASALRLDAVSGSLVAGKRADFIVLDENLLALPVNEISEVRPRETWFGGRKIFPVD